MQNSRITNCLKVPLYKTTVFVSAKTKQEFIVCDEIDQLLDYSGVIHTVSAIKILSFQPYMSAQIDETNIRLLLINRSDQGLHICHSICAFA